MPAGMLPSAGIFDSIARGLQKTAISSYMGMDVNSQFSSVPPVVIFSYFSTGILKHGWKDSQICLDTQILCIGVSNNFLSLNLNCFFLLCFSILICHLGLQRFFSKYGYFLM